MPGKVGGKSISFLIDTGCTTKILSHHVFNRLDKKLRNQLRPIDSAAKLADVTNMSFTGRIDVEGRLRSVPFKTEFLVARIRDDALLGMSFLTQNRSKILFTESRLEIDGNSLVCTDRHGRQLSTVHTLLRLRWSLVFIQISTLFSILFSQTRALLTRMIYAWWPTGGNVVKQQLQRIQTTQSDIVETTNSNWNRYC